MSAKGSAAITATAALSSQETLSQSPKLARFFTGSCTTRKSATGGTSITSPPYCFSLTVSLMKSTSSKTA